VAKLEGKDHLKVLGVDGRIILNGSARYCTSLCSDALSLDGGSCENHSESLGCVKCVELLQ